MEIISFTGKSGTGKSYQAIRVCRENGIDAIIDDGLLIYKNSIVAGASAKKCTSRAKAMRTALFNYDDQRIDVQRKLAALRPRKLLVLGTSDRMANWITDALELPRATRRLYIEDYTTEEEREIANVSRHQHGEHVIPAPMGELTRDFAGYFMHPQRIFRNFTMEGSEEKYEKTVVRPSFSYYGNFKISEGVLEDIVKIAAEEHSSCVKVLNFYNNASTSSLVVAIDIKIRGLEDVTEHILAFQKEVHDAIQTMTAFSVKVVNIQIRDIVMEREIQNSRKYRRYNSRKADRL